MMAKKVVDQRWQLALGCLGTSAAPFSQGALVKFRARMIAIVEVTDSVV